MNFVKTVIPEDDYKETEEMGGIIIRHFDPVTTESEDGTKMVTCYEGSCKKDEYDADEAKAAYLAYTKMMEEAQLAVAKRSKQADIEEYDQGDKVNGFKLNGMTVWLDKATRVGLMNSTTIAKGMGNETTTLWLGDVKLEVGCDLAIQLLSALEMYALECFNVTAAHKKAVESLETIGEVEAYDITAGYPTQLEMNI